MPGLIAAGTPVDDAEAAMVRQHLRAFHANTKSAPFIATKHQAEFLRSCGVPEQQFLEQKPLPVVVR